MKNIIVITIKIMDKMTVIMVMNKILKIIKEKEINKMINNDNI
jgi:hypothetical protein